MKSSEIQYMNKRFTYIFTLMLLLVSGATLAQEPEPNVVIGGSVFGGGNKAIVKGSCTVLVDQANASIGEDVYGGGALAKVNTDGTAYTDGKTTQVTLTQGTVTGNVYGGGLGQQDDPTTGDVNEAVAADVFGPVTVTVNGGTTTNVYGCNNLNGAPKNTVTVNVSGGSVTQDVYGGGNLASTANTVSPVVNIIGGEVGQDVYGGGALANVGGSTVNVTGGTVTRNVYGGGLGDKEDLGEGHSDVAALVNGTVEVNIGALVSQSGGFATEVSGSATIGGSVFGCNNTNGTPTDNVTVNIYQTHREPNEETSGTGYALSKVFGGGNQANYKPTAANKKATVHVWTCDNTIEYLYGGGNAADLGTDGEGNIKSATDVIIDGGRIEWVFGGGNGYSASGNHDKPYYDADNDECTATQTATLCPDYNPGANIYGNTSVTFHAGDITFIFGGSNQYGKVTGTKTVDVVGDGDCPTKVIAELYGGNNEAPAIGDISLTMGCQAGNNTSIGSVFGGSRKANITGDVTLTIKGGTYDYVFGGNNIEGIIDGNVTLNLNGGTIREAAFGGNKGGGSITGNITVNVEDLNLDCPLVVKDVFGAGDQARYTAPTNEGAREFNPIVNINHLREGEDSQTITGNVYGGGNGDPSSASQEPGMVTGNPEVIVGDAVGTHYAKVSGNVYGGGNAAKVVGSTKVLMQNANSIVSTDIYGGGNLANVSGNTDVVINGGTVSTDVYGGGALANVGTNGDNHTNVTINGGTVSGSIYGGGLGRNAAAAVGNEGDPGYVPAVSAVAALVNGAVQVTVNGGTVTGSVYGCNNINGAPQSTVKVDIYGTDTPPSGYALANVFGGGNQAAYDGSPEVTIHNCNNSIGNVYGGGNQASVVSTNVKVYGGNTIGYVFGGGNGTGVAADYEMVSGTALTNIYGGTILKVFAGNNTSGIITGSATVNVNKQTESGHDSCPMYIGEVYGGGNFAAGNAGTINIYCTGDLVALGSGQHYGVDQEGIRYVYGGANQADIGTSDSPSNITLNINSGIVENVFGGNNTSGAIYGTITVNINQDESATCLEHWYVGDVYGGGNHADYNGTPQVNIQKGTVSGNVYGGGNDITDGTKGVAGSNVEMTGGSVLGGVYGGCNEKGSVTGKSLVKIYGGTVGSSSGTRADVFGGGLGQNTMVNGDVEVIVNKTGSNETHIYGDVYGGSAKGKVNCTSAGNAQTSGAKTDVTLTLGTIYGNLYGGGLGETNGAAADVWGPVTVTVSGGLVSTYNSEAAGGNVYGCNNYNGAPQVSTSVVISGGTVARDVFGGGNLANASIATQVTVNGGTVSRDVYGGGALANTGATTVDIKSGTITGNIYGGGLGDGSHTPQETGAILVNIGWANGATSGSSASIEHNGTATIGGNVYGCNNTAGSPQDNVTVNVYGTAHNTTNTATYTENDGTNGNPTYAIANVFGGGNKANYEPETGASSKKATVNVFGCKNTIGRVFGGGDAAATPSVETDIQGGRMNMVFGGGNGEGGAPGANVHGTVNLSIHGGTVGEFYGGSNQYGTIDEAITTVVDNNGPCQSLNITEFFCGGNFVDITNNLTTTIECSDNMNVTSLYGGCNQASITGNVVLNVYGGTYDTIFGGSKGRLPGTNSLTDPGKEANITGNVTLNLYGGTVKNVFGGSNVLGNIQGNITVNVLDVESNTCPLYITNLYGGSNLTDYEPTSASAISPVVNVVHIKSGISGNVYGGSKGVEGATGEDVTKVVANPLVNIGYDAATMNNSNNVSIQSYVSAHSSLIAAPRAIVSGSVFGGGDAAKIEGNTAIFLRNRSKVFGNVYGGGNMGEVTGNTKVIVDGVNH